MGQDATPYKAILNEAVALERERCAKIADDEIKKAILSPDKMEIPNIAAKIRES